MLVKGRASRGSNPTHLTNGRDGSIFDVVRLATIHASLDCFASPLPIIRMQYRIEEIEIDFGFRRKPEVPFALFVPNNMAQRHFAMKRAEFRCVHSNF